MDWIEGDIFGMAMPTCPQALRDAGTDYLTRPSAGSDRSETAIV